MRKHRFLFFLLLTVQLISFCNNHQDKKNGTSSDSVKQAGDSLASEEELEYRDCNHAFFSSASKAIDTAAVRLKLKNNHEVNWRQFLNDELMSTQVRFGMKDLDSDGTEELVVFNYTGGAHCCDEIYIFAKEGQQYVQTAKLFGGYTCVHPSGNLFTYSFNEALGYFYACYACGFSDSTGNFRTIREIDLQYQQGRFVVVRYQPETEQQVYRNLDLLSKHRYEEMEEGLMDSGWRKEFAMNFAVWHYNHGKNWQATRSLFDRYYKFKDAGRVWREFEHAITEMEKQNDF